jgi:hypothetical protein
MSGLIVIDRMAAENQRVLLLDDPKGQPALADDERELTDLAAARGGDEHRAA